jgi:integrase
MARPYFLSIRKTEKGIVYYAHFRDENGELLSPRSTGQDTEEKAHYWCLTQIKNQTYKQKKKVQGLTLGEFAKDFFDWDNCGWIKEQHAYDRAFQRSTAANRRHCLLKHVIPTFGEMKLKAITREKVKAYLLSLGKYSNQTKNHILYTLKIILDYAAREKGLIKPVDFVGLSFSLNKDQIRKRDIFTLEELKKLFPENIVSIWGDIKRGSMFYTMLITGIRSGEVRALTWAKWQSHGLFIDRAVKNCGGIGSTKTGEIRFVPLNSRAERYLEQWKGESQFTQDEDLIFYGRGGPYSTKEVDRYFAQVLKKQEIKINQRWLVPHSLRHTFNTFMRTVLPAAVLQACTGHKSEGMSNHYDHPSIGEMNKRVEPARAMLEKIF